MKNPWLMKNPYLSLWLTGANKVGGAARGHATAALKREAATAYQTATTEATAQVLDFWLSAWGAPTRRSG